MMKKLPLILVCLSTLAQACPELRAECVSKDAGVSLYFTYASVYNGAAPECKGVLTESDIVAECRNRIPDLASVNYTIGADSVVPFLPLMVSSIFHWIISAPNPFLGENGRLGLTNLWATSVYVRAISPSRLAKIFPLEA